MNKKALSQIYVMFDTNAIMAQTGDRLFSRSAVNAMQDPSHESLNISWLIPAMVRSEREHQIRQLVKGIISTAVDMPALFADTWVNDVNAVNSRISAIVTNELQQLKVAVRECDPGAVDWAHLMNCAGFRMPPFDINASKEKGFKDAVIAETFIQLCSALPAYGTERAILVTDDTMLGENVTARVRAPGIKVLRNLDALRNELNFLASDIPPDDQIALMDRALELIKEDANFWGIVRGSIDNLFRSGVVQQRVGVFNVVYDEPFYAAPVFLRKDLGHVHFSCRINYKRRGSRWVTGLTGPDQTPVGLINAAMPEGHTPSAGRHANGMPMQGELIDQGLFGLGVSSMPPGHVETVELPPVTFLCEWRATYNIAGVGNDAGKFEISSPFVLSVELVQGS